VVPRANCDCGREVIARARNSCCVGGYSVVAPAYWASTGWKKAATRLLANVADLSAGFFKGLGVLAAHRLRKTSEALWVIAFRYRHNTCEELWQAIASYIDGRRHVADDTVRPDGVVVVSPDPPAPREHERAR
jgi:hypothetical protein